MIPLKNTVAIIVIVDTCGYLCLVLAADQTRAMQEQFSGQGLTGPQDPQKAFKAEWEALQIANHQWALEGVEEDVTGQIILMY